MRALLCLALAAASTTSVHAEDMGMIGVETTGDPGRIFMAIVLGKLDCETRGDDQGRSPTRYDGWSYGLSVRGEYIGLRSSYGGRFGGTVDADLWAFTPGTLRRGDESTPLVEPPVSWVFAGFTPALALGVVGTKSLDLAIELGVPVNTDFYGLSAGGILRVKSFYLSYKVRSGAGWQGTQVLDERIRIGYATSKRFIGLDITHGYSEDEMSRASLKSIFKGSYTFVSLVVSAGR